jgi:hypothetical protein
MPTPPLRKRPGLTPQLRIVQLENPAIRLFINENWN